MTDRQEQVIAEAQRYRDQWEKTYRAQALKMYPWICGRCGREFSGKKLRELTVHHRDHNHDNNPPDGATGSCCVSTVTTMSTRGIRWLTPMARRRRVKSASRLLPTGRSQILRTYYSVKHSALQMVTRKLPDGKGIVPGMIDSTTNCIEPATLVAWKRLTLCGVLPAVSSGH